MKINAKTKICMVIGSPVEHSLSPQIHNAGYVALHIDDKFVYVACHVDANEIENFVKGMRAMQIHGVSCTIPHKITIMPYLDEIDDIAKKIGAVNTVINENGKLRGINTDWRGIIDPLVIKTEIKDKKIALIGAGGAARAAAYAITSNDGELWIFNRTVQRAQQLANDFNGKAYSLNDLGEIKEADIIINTTSVGLNPDKNETPIPKEYIHKGQIVYDVVYGKNETQLIKDAKNQGADTISGIEMLLFQGYAQFKLFTNYDAPVDAMKKAIL